MNVYQDNDGEVSIAQRESYITHLGACYTILFHAQHASVRSPINNNNNITWREWFNSGLFNRHIAHKRLSCQGPAQLPLPLFLQPLPPPDAVSFPCPSAVREQKGSLGLHGNMKQQCGAWGVPMQVHSVVAGREATETCSAEVGAAHGLGAVVRPGDAHAACGFCSLQCMWLLTSWKLDNPYLTQWE